MPDIEVASKVALHSRGDCSLAVCDACRDAEEAEDGFVAAAASSSCVAPW